MSKSASVQAFATLRNEQVEIFVDYALQQFSRALFEADLTSALAEPMLHTAFKRDDCSDVFDHYLKIEGKGNNKTLEIWGQTTCYKGNKGMGAEPNKTYEVRETLIEALGLRRWLIDEGVPFRTVHFTIGSPDYTYGWFRHAKDNSFDLSLYIGSQIDGKNIFDTLADLFAGARAEYELYSRLDAVMAQDGSAVRGVIDRLCQQLVEWYGKGGTTCPMADKQASLLTKVSNAQAASASRSIAASKYGGQNIKKRAIELLGGSDETDPAMFRTMQRLSRNKPFLGIAMEALIDWATWSKAHFTPPRGCKSLEKYISFLWTLHDGSQLASRRLLARIHSDGFVQYPADLEIAGLTEHNLYGGTHSVKQIGAVTKKISNRLNSVGISSANALYLHIAGKRGQRLIKDALRAESYNGTTLQPSFDYVEEVLSGEYRFSSCKEAGLALPIGYHAFFDRSSVKPYNNLKVIIRISDKKPLAIIKAKYFRKQEFPRRAKEEAYVGLTLKFSYNAGFFHEHYPSMPIIMFVDMDADLVPQEYAVRRLATAGWEIFFSIDSLRDFLEGLPTPPRPLGV